MLFEAIRPSLLTTNSCNLTATSIRRGRSCKPLPLTGTRQPQQLARLPDLVPPTHWSNVPWQTHPPPPNLNFPAGAPAPAGRLQILDTRVFREAVSSLHFSPSTLDPPACPITCSSPPPRGCPNHQDRPLGPPPRGRSKCSRPATCQGMRETETQCEQTHLGAARQREPREGHDEGSEA